MILIHYETFFFILLYPRCFGLDYNVSSKNILIKNVVTHYGESGVAIGSEVSGGVENITILNSVFHNPVKAGVRIKSG